MAKVTLDGEKYDLVLDYDAIEYLEEHFDEDILTVMNEIDVKQSTQRNFIYAMNMNQQGLELSEVKAKMRSMFDKGDYDYGEVMKPITEAFKESQAFKKMAEKNKKKSQPATKNESA